MVILFSSLNLQAIATNDTQDKQAKKSTSMVNYTKNINYASLVKDLERFYGKDYVKTLDLEFEKYISAKMKADGINFNKAGVALKNAYKQKYAVAFVESTVSNLTGEEIAEQRGTILKTFVRTQMFTICFRLRNTSGEPLKFATIF